MAEPAAVIEGSPENPVNPGRGPDLNPAADGALVDRLRLLAAAPDDDVIAPSRRRYLIGMISIGIVLFVGLMIFIALTIWRLHGPQFRLLDDGWYRVTDREFGFVCELPGWYTCNPRPGMQGTEYTSRFESSWGMVSIVAQRWTPKTSGRTATGELRAVIAAEQARGTVTVLIDQSSSPTAPMIDYVVDYGTTGSPVKMRRRVMIEKKVRLDITIQASDTIPASDIDRFLDAIKSLQ